MPTFIDESGDTGTKKGASACFRLAAVVFGSAVDVEDYSRRLAALRAKLRLPEKFEFHFSKTGHRLKVEFFRAFTTTSFSFVVSSIRKSTLAREELNKQAIHRMAVGGLTKHLENWYLSQEERLQLSRGLRDLVVYDRCDDVSFERVLKDGFRPLRDARPCGRQLVRDIRSSKSHAEPGIQLADMICGAIGKHLDDDHCDYYRLVEHKALAIEQPK